MEAVEAETPASTPESDASEGQVPPGAAGCGRHGSMSETSIGLSKRPDWVMDAESIRRRGGERERVCVCACVKMVAATTGGVGSGSVTNRCSQLSGLDCRCSLGQRAGREGGKAGLIGAPSGLPRRPRPATSWVRLDQGSQRLGSINDEVTRAEASRS